MACENVLDYLRARKGRLEMLASPQIEIAVGGVLDLSTTRPDPGMVAVSSLQNVTKEKPQIGSRQRPQRAQTLRRWGVLKFLQQAV